MTLGFKQYFPWHTEKDPAPTNFREKIITCAMMQRSKYGGLPEGTPFQSIIIDGEINYIPFLHKIHTMRSDPHNRWKAGRKIEMVYRGAGYKILDHFNKGIPELEVCKRVQEVSIVWYRYHLKPLTILNNKGGSAEVPVVKIDGREISGHEVEILARNDGFNSVEDFFRWFNKDWSGKIIHFTDFRY